MNIPRSRAPQKPKSRIKSNVSSAAPIPSNMAVPKIMVLANLTMPDTSSRLSEVLSSMRWPIVIFFLTAIAAMAPIIITPRPPTCISMSIISRPPKDQ